MDRPTYSNRGPWCFGWWRLFRRNGSQGLRLPRRNCDRFHCVRCIFRPWYFQQWLLKTRPPYSTIRLSMAQQIPIASVFQTNMWLGKWINAYPTVFYRLFLLFRFFFLEFFILGLLFLINFSKTIPGTTNSWSHSRHIFNITSSPSPSIRTQICQRCFFLVCTPCMFPSSIEPLRAPHVSQAIFNIL